MYTYNAEYNEYASHMEVLAAKEYYAANNICQSCGGFGDHGTDEDGCLYVCYGCGGTGKFHGAAA